jgi:tetratricopeptide (TPR) repeat protein
MPRSAPAPRASRPFRALPPLTRGPEPVEGFTLLDEVPGDLGVVLWQTLRNVLLWARTPAEERGAVFARAAAERRAQVLGEVTLDAPLREPLTEVAALLSAPLAAAAERVALACERISRWAEERAAAGTALAFGQAAALAQPEDAARACAVGRLARRNGEATRAEGWLHTAIVLARRSGDHTSYARALLGLGNLAVQGGNLPRAQVLHRRALQTARRHRLRSVEAQALHDLFVTAAETGSDDEAREAAAGALRAYGSDHPRLPVLAADVACFWVARGQFERALPVLRAAAPRVADAAERTVVLANAARAAAGAGDGAAYAELAAEVRERVAEGLAGPAASQAWLNLARGALSLGRMDLARDAAERAVSLAGPAREGKVRASAESLLSAARGGGPAPAPAAPAPAADGPAAVLAAELVRCLAAAV